MHETLIVSPRMNVNVIEAKTGGLERLYLETADSEHIEMYLKAMWRILEKGEEINPIGRAYTQASDEKASKSRTGNRA